MDGEVTENDQAPQPMRTGTDIFTTRRENVFSALEGLEKKHLAFVDTLSSTGTLEDKQLMKKDPAEDEELDKYVSAKSRQIRKCEYKHSDHQGASSSFRQRETTHSRQWRPNNRQKPSFKERRQLENYTFYSLKDVSSRDMSETSNSQAAFAFLKERRMLREKEERKRAGLPEEDITFDTESTACSKGRIEFSKPHKRDQSDSKTSSQGTTRSSAKLSSPLCGEKDSGDDSQPATGTLESSHLSEDSQQTVDLDSHPDKCTSSKFRKVSATKRNIRKRHDNDDDSS